MKGGRLGSFWVWNFSWVFCLVVGCFFFLIGLVWFFFLPIQFITIPICHYPKKEEKNYIKLHMKFEGD